MARLQVGIESEWSQPIFKENPLLKFQREINNFRFAYLAAMLTPMQSLEV